MKNKVKFALVINQSEHIKNDALFNWAKRLNICKRLWIFIFCWKYEQKTQVKT